MKRILFLLLFLNVIFTPVSSITLAQGSQQVYSHHFLGAVLDENLQFVPKARICFILKESLDFNVRCTETNGTGKYDFTLKERSRDYKICASTWKKNLVSGIDESQHSICTEYLTFEAKNENREIKLNFPDKAEAIVKKFYQTYLPNFGLPSNPQINRLHIYLSPTLYSLLKRENQRLIDWSKKNPELKPPIDEDLFTCNYYERPQKFKIIYAKQDGHKFNVSVGFIYFDKGKEIDRCNVEVKVINLKGKWLVDNIMIKGQPDLKTILARKDYEILPK